MPNKPSFDQVLSSAVDVILNNKINREIKAILLFGSHADGTAIWRSDIDICVVFKKDVTDKEAFLFRKNLLGQLPDVVDLQVFNVLPQKIKRAIAENHRILFQSEDFEDITFTRVNQELYFELERRIVAMGT
jgi:predicted nucleotidyltransferase